MVNHRSRCGAPACRFPRHGQPSGPMRNARVPLPPTWSTIGADAERPRAASPDMVNHRGRCARPESLGAAPAPRDGGGEVARRAARSPCRPCEPARRRSAKGGATRRSKAHMKSTRPSTACGTRSRRPGGPFRVALDSPFHTGEHGDHGDRAPGASAVRTSPTSCPSCLWVNHPIMVGSAMPPGPPTDWNGSDPRPMWSARVPLPPTWSTIGADAERPRAASPDMDDHRSRRVRSKSIGVLRRRTMPHWGGRSPCCPILVILVSSV